MQGAEPIATWLAAANLLYCLIITAAGLGQPALKAGRRAFARQFLVPLRVNAYMVFLIGLILIKGSASSNDPAFLPGLAALFFGIGNFLQSSSRNAAYRAGLKATSIKRALLHPAVWYGIGYTLTGIAIGGGLVLLAHPLANPLAACLTLIGVLETGFSISLMVSGNVVNQAVPFVGVAIGTSLFALTGIVMKNYLGAATGLFACLGELSLAILMQQLQNATLPLVDRPASKIESVLTLPIRWAMRQGWISSIRK